MASDAARYYIRRKLGVGMGIRCKARTMLPLFVLFLITSTLTFAMTFITSMAAEIDRMIAVMGSGSIWCLSDPSEALPDDAEVSPVAISSALAYSENSESAVVVKGVDEAYFSGYRKEELKLETFEGDCINPVTISSAMADELSLSAGDRFALLMWEKDKGRARPLLCTVSSIFRSVYPQLDSALVYVPLSLFGNADGYEVLLPRGEEPDALMRYLWNEGIVSETYKTLYPSLYSNVISSLSILFVILASVALLAAFFSSDAAEYYVDRDREEIQGMRLLGASRRMLRHVYFSMTLSLVAFIAVLGIACGLLLSFCSPFLLEAVADRESALLEYYATTFVIEVPYTALFVTFVLIVLVSALSIAFSLRRRGVAALF
ncbi:MAG: FtsX-like permease family protein [Spirochaetes bacterium]|uniref:FtsX-like permease family protein n=1 Tax=Candidatus Ornithospirochaeta stercoripullorum TaxID=2840899 RepID=A0A9D9DZ51_9SPIO|nr:FtsX-like permease family protein [Candidatus Ornithospirochaeta stercoripullorum]